jgi:hypothetical protein
MEGDVLTYSNVLATVMAGLVLEGLRRFGQRLTSLEKRDSELRADMVAIEANLEKEITNFRVETASKLVTRNELDTRSRDMRQDLHKMHADLVQRLDKITEQMDQRLARVESSQKSA